MGISIVIPTHNRPGQLLRAVTSALASTAGEVVVVDDGEVPARETLAGLAGDARLRVLENAGDHGASGARNFGVAAATGDTILFLDDDDELVSGYADRVREVPAEVAWGFARTITRTEAGEVAAEGRAVSRRMTARESFRSKVAALSAGFWIRRAVFGEVGGLNVGHRLDEDTDLCCRLMAAGALPWFDAAPATIVDRTEDPGRLTSSGTRKAAEMYLETFRRNIGPCARVPGAAAYLAYRANRMALRCGDRAALSEISRGVGVGLKIGLYLQRLRYLTF